MVYILALICSFVFCLFSISLLRIVAGRFNIFVQRKIPSIGGICIGAAFLLTCGLCSIFLGVFQERILIFLAISGLLLIVGILDDLIEFSIAKKVLAQIGVSLLLIASGVRTEIVFIGPVLNVIISLIWIMAITNAFNLLDVADGLLGLVSIVTAAAFMVIAAINQDVQTIYFLICLLGALFGFILFNIPRAQIFMGNSGSHFIGFLFAAIALMIHYAPMERKLALVSPILILGFPIFDTLLLITFRLRKGKSIIRKSPDHLVLQLIRAGYPKATILLWLVGLTIVYASCGIIISQVDFRYGVISLGIACGITIGMLFKLRLMKRM